VRRKVLDAGGGVLAVGRYFYAHRIVASNGHFLRRVV
jgi:hypothetical protein